MTERTNRDPRAFQLREYANNDDAFHRWLCAVDAAVREQIEVGLLDLSEFFSYRAAFDAGEDPVAVAKRAVEDNT